MRRFAGPGVWTLALMVAGCPRPPARTDARQRAAAQDVGAADDAPVERAPLPPLPVEEALDLVPSGALLVAHAPSWSELLARLGRDRYAGAHPEHYEEIARGLGDALGVDVLDPAELPRVGVDPAGPVGFALLGLEPMAFTVYCRVLDPQALERFVSARLGGEGIDTTVIGDARVLRPRAVSTVALVLRRDFAGLVWNDAGGPGRPDFAATMAEGDARRSIHHDPRFAPVLARLPAPAHFVGLVDAAGLLERTLGGPDVVVPEPPPPPAGATSADLDAWQAQRQDMERFAREEQARRAREREGIERVFGDLSVLGAAVVLSRGQLFMRGVTALPPRSSWRELLGPALAPAVVRALTGRPMFVLSASVRPGPALRLLEGLAAIDGGTPAQLRHEFAAEVGVGLDETVAALSGELAVALVLRAIPKKADRERIRDAHGLVLTAGLRDPSAATRLLSALAAAPGHKLVHDAALDAWVLDTPDWHELLIAVVDHRLWVTSEREALARVRAGKPAVLDRHVPDAELRALIERPAPAVAYVDALGTALEDAYFPPPVIALDPVTEHGGLDVNALGRVPKSKQYRAKFREYEKLVAQLNRAQARRSQQALAAAIETGRALGRFVSDVEQDELGFRLHLTWKLGVDDLAAVVHTLVERPRSVEEERELVLAQRRWQLESELRELRTREIEAYLRASGDHQ